MEQADISKVRASVHQQCGNRVKIQLDRGRNKVDIQEGVIQERLDLSAYSAVQALSVLWQRLLLLAWSALLYRLVL